MSVTTKAIVFLTLTFAISWPALIYSWSQGRTDVTGGGVWSLIYVASPAIAALVCSIAFEKGQRLKALGMRFMPNWWWLWALLIPFGLMALVVLITVLFSPYKLLGGVEEMARQLATLQHQDYSDATAYLLQSASAMGVSIVGFSLLFTLTEEVGWRGYLYHIWRRFGFWRYSLVVGVIWGVWHWPMIYLFGLNYPDDRVLGLFIFPIFTVLAAVLATLVRDRGRSVWAAGVLHGTLNAIGALAVIPLEAPQFPWTIVGISGIAALAIAALLVALAQRRDTYREA